MKPDSPELDEAQNRQRGLVIISALINFVDWLDCEDLLPEMSEYERGQLVVKFLKAHAEGENYFMQAEQIAGLLSQPFTKEGSDHEQS